MRRFVTLLLVLMLAATSLATGALAEGQTDENVTIQIIVPSNVQDFPDGVTEDDNFIVDYYKEVTGYDFDIVVLGSEDEATQLNVMFNSGEVNGIVVSRNIKAIGTLASQGLLLNLDPYKEESALYNMFVDENLVGMYDGSQYSFVIPDAITAVSYLGAWCVNKGAMAEMGYDQPPKTFEELDSFLYAAKDAGYIPFATYGDAGKGNNESTFSLIQGMFGLGGGEYGVDEEGNVYYKYITEDAKAYLEYCKKLYDDGIIPADFASQTEDGIIELMLSGKALTANGIAIWSGTNLMQQAETLGLDLKWADYPTDRNGERAWSSINGGYGAAALGFMISSSCNYVDQALEVIDMMCTPEAITLANYGIEGTHYELDENGEIQPIEGAESIDWAVYFRNVFLPEDWYQVYGVGSGWAEYMYPAERNSVGNPNGDPMVFLPPLSEELETLTELSENLIIPYYTQVIMGEASIDDWDNIVSQWKSQGGDAAMQAYTELYAECGSPELVYSTYLPADHPAYTGKYLFNGEADMATQITAE